MQSNYQNNLNNALKELQDTKSISSALLVCNTLLEYMSIETKPVEDIELSKLKLPNAERYDRWFDAHPHFRGDRACFDIAPQSTIVEAKFFALQKRSKLSIAGAVSFTPNFEDRDYTRNDPNMKVGIDFFFTPEKDSVIVVLSNKGSLRLVELSGRLTNTQNDIFNIWHNIAQTTDKNIFHTTIWESFKLSSLNKKFYEGIANSFYSLTQHLQDNKVEQQLANQFANRLHGRLLFLWFLRKKNIINESKEYFTLGDKTDTDYYTNTLSTLFFNVLNNEDHKDFDPITPYLNGGLFDQNSDGEYWNKNKPTFPKGFFRALYDHFDSFNFTTDESTPEYEQIAIDPEMLGRIFESFLATLTTETGAQAKKANGAFYTPREIVSYMSRESLRQYLYTALDAGTTLKSSIDDLLDRPDSEWALAGTNSRRDAVSNEDRDRIMEALRNIKVLDPAVGSGAFPMGVLHKILSLFERLEPNFDSYETKLSILKNNIYGVDIDPTAIEISRLRAWLSIIVDVKDIKKIKPLPNLDFKFVCANSLISLNTTTDNLFEDVENNVINQLRDLFEKYYSESRKKAKEKLKTDIETVLQHSKVFLQAGSSFKEKLDTYKPFNTSNKAEFYNPKLMHGIDSFDLVIGNPPYVSTKGVDDLIKKDLERDYGFSDDLYSHFYFKGIELSKEFGVLSYITSKTFWTIQTKKNLRELFLNNNVVIIYDTANPFESAMVDTCVILIQKVNTKNNNKIKFLKSENGYKNPITQEVEKTIYENAVNKVIFNPSSINLTIYHKYNDIVNGLIKKWWLMISTSKNIAKFSDQLENYRKNLKPGDVTLLGLITDGGQGLATANNGKYVGVLSTTKEASKISASRMLKFFEFTKGLKDTEDQLTKESFSKLSEEKIRSLFDSFKEKYGRDIFGQGFLFRIVSPDEVKDIKEMTQEEKDYGLSGSKTFVPYDKGDKDGNRWYLRTPYYIDWSKKNVTFLKENSGKKGEGMPVVRSPQFYFRAGFCWSDIHTVLIKTRLKEQSIHDVKSMSMFSFSPLCTDKYLVSMLNSTLVSNYDFSFVNSTSSFQINDARQIPIIIPTKKQLNDFEDLFDRAYAIKIQQFDGKISNQIADKNLQEIQSELDEKTLTLYGLNGDEK